MWFQSVQYDLQHDFAWVADEANRSLVLVLLQVAFLGKCDDQGLGPRGWSILLFVVCGVVTSHVRDFFLYHHLIPVRSPVCQILLQTVVRTVIAASPPAWTSSAGMFSTSADFPFFQFFFNRV